MYIYIFLLSQCFDFSTSWNAQYFWKSPFWWRPQCFQDTNKNIKKQPTNPGNARGISYKKKPRQSVVTCVFLHPPGLRRPESPETLGALKISEGFFPEERCREKHMTCSSLKLRGLSKESQGRFPTYRWKGIWYALLVHSYHGIWVFRMLKRLPPKKCQWLIDLMHWTDWTP